MGKKIEDKYKVLDQISHILLRPGTYVGSNKPSIMSKFVIENELFTKKDTTFIPSFIKIFDEVITNSVDESKRNKKLNRVDINIDLENNKISIRDNGGIEVVMHKEHKQYIPEVVFGNLMSGTNFSDDEDRVVAGTNGLGSKLTNVFSTKFIVSTCDGKNSFLQTFENNMRDRNKPVIKKSNKSHTEITFFPDMSQFNMSSITEDHYKLIEKRVYDLAGCNNSIKFYFNNKLVSMNSFDDYIKLYTKEFFYESNIDKSWSIGISLSENGFQQVSFVNSTETYDGGTHVDYIMNQIISELREFFSKKHKVDIKPNELRSHIFLFLNSTIINPSFSSQTKEKLITEVKDFGFVYEVSKKLVQQIIKSDIVNSILDWIERKKDADENKLLRTLSKSKIKVDKLIDCSSKTRKECSLLIMEGLSALGDFRKYRDSSIQAAYSLRGKFTNISGMSNTKIMENEEAKNLILSIGLDIKNIENIKNIRFGKIIICTDMDTDGDSICAQLINFFSKWDIIDEGMVYRAIAPILVAKSKTKKKEKIYFYTMEEYDIWLSKNNVSNFEIDYKKGLGSLEPEEFKILIQNPRLVKFTNLDSNELSIWFGDDSVLRKNKLL